MEPVFLVIATLCYLSGAVGYQIYLVRDLPKIHKVSWSFLLVGAISHAFAVGLRSFHAGQLAVTTSREALSFFALVLVVAYVLIQIRLRLRLLGSFVSPLAVLFMLGSALLPSPSTPISAVLQSGWVAFHVTSLFLAYALFALAFSAGVMYLLQERQIKHKSYGFLYSRFPSLERLDGINHYCLLAGFPLMTVGLVTGFAYAGVVWGAAWKGEPKEVGALATWFVYAVLLHERLTVGWRGRRAAWLAIIGFTAALVTFLGVNLVFKGRHTLFIG